MPSRAAEKPVAKPRFELPALDLNFGNITDGTNIPPPPASPVARVPTPPRTPPAVGEKLAAGTENRPGANDTQLPASQNAPALDYDRPQSRGGFSLMGDRKSKRSSGWFKRLRTGDQQPRRSSFLFGSTSTSPRKPQSPPPPMIPELKELEKDDGSLGTDIFKSIRSIK